MVTERGTVRVNQFLEVPGHPGVFAAGDIIDYPEQKQAAKANGHIKVVAENVVSFLQSKPLKKSYTGSPDMILIPLGKVRGCLIVTACGHVLICESTERWSWFLGFLVGYSRRRLGLQDSERKGPDGPCGAYRPRILKRFAVCLLGTGDSNVLQSHLSISSLSLPCVCCLLFIPVLINTIRVLIAVSLQLFNTRHCY